MNPTLPANDVVLIARNKALDSEGHVEFRLTPLKTAGRHQIRRSVRRAPEIGVPVK